MLRLLRTFSSWRSISMNNTLPNSSLASSISSAPTPTPPQKRTILANLKSTTDSCDDVLRKIEKEGGFQISRPDLNRWIALFEKRGQIQKSIEIDSFKEWKYIGLMKTYKPCFGRTNVGDPLPTSSLASSNSSTSSSTDANPPQKRTILAKLKPSTDFGRDTLRRAAAIIAPTVVHILASVERLEYDKAYSQSVQKVKVFLNDGKKFIGVVSEYRVWKDVALVKIDVPTSVALVAAKWGIDKGVCLGDLVLAVGSTNAWPNSFSKGMISCLKRTSKEANTRGGNNLYIQTDCATCEGNSGGPLVNLNGEVIGMIIGGEQGKVEFALSLDSVFKVLKAMRYKCASSSCTTTTSSTRDSDSKESMSPLKSGGDLNDTNVPVLSRLQLKRPIAGSQVPFCPGDKKMLDCWTTIEPNSFRVRGRTYLSDKKKEFAPRHAAYNPFGVDVFLSERKINHVAQYVKLPVTTTSTKLPSILVVNVQVPLYTTTISQVDTDGEGMNIVLYFKLSDNYSNELPLHFQENIQRLIDDEVEKVKRFHMDVTVPFRERIKILGRVANVDTLHLSRPEKKLMKAYNERPLLSRLQHEFYLGENYFEIDIDMRRFSDVSRKGFKAFIDRLKICVLDVGLTIQGKKTEELPEQILCCVKLNEIDYVKYHQLAQELF
ncbi:unnamed protein product [Brassica oleracea var. botrytis]